MLSIQIRSNIKIQYKYKRKAPSNANNNFDILLRNVNYAPNLHILKSIKNNQIIKCYLYNKSWVFGFSYKLYLAQNLQFCLGTTHLISRGLCKYIGRKCVNTMGRQRVCSCREKKYITSKIEVPMDFQNSKGP